MEWRYVSLALLCTHYTLDMLAPLLTSPVLRIDTILFQDAHNLALIHCDGNLTVTAIYGLVEDGKQVTNHRRRVRWGSGA